MHEISYSFLTTPGLLIVLVLAGICASWRWRRVGMSLAIIAAVFLYVLSTPLASSWLIDRASTPAAPAGASAQEAKAIVVLAADLSKSNGTFCVGPLTLDRLLKAAQVYRQTSLPILVTGGPIDQSPQSAADLMADVLEQDFHVPVRWREQRSSTTMENARFSAEMLKQDGISTVILVTQAWHAPRAQWAFQHAGIEAIPTHSDAGSPSEAPYKLDDLLPGFADLQWSTYALHELLGLAFYRWRYG